MRLMRHRRGNPDPEYVEAYTTAPPLDSTEGLPYFRSSEESSVRRDFGKILRCAQNDESDPLAMKFLPRTSSEADLRMRVIAVQ